MQFCLNFFCNPCLSLFINRKNFINDKSTNIPLTKNEIKKLKFDDSIIINNESSTIIGKFTVLDNDSILFNDYDDNPLTYKMDNIKIYLLQNILNNDYNLRSNYVSKQISIDGKKVGLCIANPCLNHNKYIICKIDEKDEKYTIFNELEFQDKIIIIK